MMELTKDVVEAWRTVWANVYRDSSAEAIRSVWPQLDAIADAALLGLRAAGEKQCAYCDLAEFAGKDCQRQASCPRAGRAAPPASAPEPVAWMYEDGNESVLGPVLRTSRMEISDLTQWKETPLYTQPATAHGERQDGEALARQFHEIYERLAPSFGYETRTETRQFDPNSPNGKLMIAVCSALSPSATPKEQEE